MKRTKQSNTNLEAEIIIIEAFKSTGYLIVNKTLIKQIGLIPAIILSNYIDKHIYFRKQRPENNGWFFLTHANQTEQLGLSDHQIRQAKKKLIAADYIVTEMRGIPPKEWYIINFVNLYKGIFLKKLKELPLKDLRNIKETKIKENKNINNSEQKSSDNNTSQKRNKQFLPLARHLSKTIQTNKNIHHTALQLKTWTNDIRQLVENNKVDVTRIKKALRWYKQHIGQQYVPVIESGRSLKDKFTGLEDAMKREGQEYGNNKPDMIMEDGRKWYLAKDGAYYAKDGTLYEG